MSRFFLFLFFILSLNSFAETVKISGSGTLFDAVVKYNSSNVETATGLTLEVTKSSTGKGLADLLDGKVDLAMSSEPLDIAVQALQAAGKSVDVKKLKLHELKQEELVFVVNKSNPISKLTREQLKGIFTGKTLNWKEVGGNDSAIAVFTDDPSSGTSALIKYKINFSQDYGHNRKSFSTIDKVSLAVADNVAGIAGVSQNLAKKAGVKIIDSGDKLERSMGFITIGEPRKNAAKVIKAFQDLPK